jgi:DNA (cytosine-5)-methyltransferase 1
MADTSNKGLQGSENAEGYGKDRQEPGNKQPAGLSIGTQWNEIEPGMGRVVDGLAYRVDRIKALGNGQVPLQAAVAWKLLGGP